MTLQEPRNPPIANVDIPDTEVIVVAHPSPVFVDSTGRRRRLLKRVAYAFGALCMIYGGLISVSLAGGPVSPSAVLPLPDLADGVDEQEDVVLARPSPMPKPPTAAPTRQPILEVFPRRAAPVTRTTGAGTAALRSTPATPQRSGTPSPRPTKKPSTRPTTTRPIESGTTKPSTPESTPPTAETTTPVVPPVPPTGTGGGGGAADEDDEPVSPPAEPTPGPGGGGGGGADDEPGNPPAPQVPVDDPTDTDQQPTSTPPAKPEPNSKPEPESEPGSEPKTNSEPGPEPSGEATA